MEQHNNEPQTETKPYLGFSDKSQVGNVVWTIFWVFMVGLVALSLFGCVQMPQKVEARTVAGVQIVAHIDTGDAPYPCGISHRHGCHQKIGGVSHVWYSEVSPSYVLHHEIKGHAMDMEHGPYAKHGPFGSDWCATVTRGNQYYPLGSLVCNDGRNEYFLELAA